MTGETEIDAHVQALWQRIERIEAQLGPALKRAANRFDKIDPEKIYDEMVEVGERYAEAQYLADMTEAATEKAFDETFVDAEGSVEQRKALARLSKMHQDANRAWIAAKKIAHMAKLEWAAVTTKLEFQRTLETSLREQARNIDKSRG